MYKRQVDTLSNFMNSTKEKIVVGDKRAMMMKDSQSFGKCRICEVGESLISYTFSSLTLLI